MEAAVKPKTSGAPAASPLSGADLQGAPEPALRGRFALYPQDPKGAIISYATGLCQTCTACGCGDQQEPLDLTPAGMMKMMGRMGKMKSLIGL